MNQKTIQRRIKSVKNTRKITKAMELVAAAKMRKSTEAVVGSRPYVRMLREVVRNIALTTDITTHPLLRRGEGRERVLLVLMMSDRGLAGGYNVQMVREVKKWKEKHAVEVEVDVIAIGKRAAHASKKIGLNVVGFYTDFTNSPSIEGMRPVVRTIIDGYAKAEYDDVFIAYTDFKSAVSQVPVVDRFLPLVKMRDSLGEVNEKIMDPESGSRKDEDENTSEFTFEPNKKEILNSVLPRIVESISYQALLEAAASEHASRMMAMRSATDAAGDMIDSLTLTYNQARQAGITQEIAEISGGAAALE